MMNKHKNSFRNAAILGTVLFIAASSVSFYYINSELRSAIEKAGENSNATLTRVFVNETWSEVSPLLPPPGSSEQDAAKNPNIKKIDNRIRRFMSYTDVLKVKLYNVKGLTVYSSETSQIGEDKSKNLGFQQALKGKLASELTYRGKFGGFDGELFNRNLVSTYAPIRDGYQVVAVAELYSDRTASIEQAAALRNELLIVLISTFGMIYGLMLYFSYRAFKRIISGLEPQAMPTKGHTDRAGSNGGQASQEGAFSVAGAPFPELSLIGVQRLIHQLNLAVDSNGRLDTRIDPRLLLADVAKSAKDVSERISRYRLFGSAVQEKRHTASKLDFEHLIRDVTEYAQTHGSLKNIKFHQGQRFQNDFIQDSTLIEAFMTSFIDFIGASFSEAEVEVKFFGEEDTLSIELIMQKFSGEAKPGADELFKAFDGQLTAAAKAAGFAYRATLTDRGLLVSIKAKASALSSVESGTTKHKSAVVFSRSELDAKLFVSALDRCGVRADVVMASQELSSAASGDGGGLLFILQAGSGLGADELESIARIAKQSGLQPRNTYVVTDSPEGTDLARYGFQVLRMPLDTGELARLVQGS